jgi:hypothetical protein
MPLQRKELEIPISGGLDVKQSTELQDAGSLRESLNLRFDALGELRKRPTHASSTTPSPVTDSDYADSSPECIFGRDTETFCLTRDLGVVSVDPANPNDCVWPTTTNLKYTPRACRVSRRFVERSQYGREDAYIYQVTSTVYGSDLVIAWISVSVQGGDYSLKIKSVDVDTGQLLMPTQTIALSATISQCIASCTYEVGGFQGAIITYSTGTSSPTTIKCVLYDATTRTLNTSTSNLTTNSRYSQHAIASVGGEFYFAFCDNTSAVLKCLDCDAFNTINATHTGTGTSPNNFTITAHSNFVVIGTITATTVEAELFGDAGGRVTVFTEAADENFGTITSAIEGSSPADVILFVNCQYSGSPGAFYVRSARLVNASTALTLSTQQQHPHTWTANNAFTYEDRCYVALTTSVFHEQPSILLCRYAWNSAEDTAKLEPCARMGHDRYYAFFSGILGDTYSTTVVGNKVHFVFMADASPAGAHGASVAPQSLFHGVCEFASTGDGLPLPSVNVDGTTLVASGQLLEWDGDTLSEHAPVIRPRIVLDVTGGTSQTGTFSVVAIYRWIDARGRLHRSAPSAAASTGAITAKDIKVYVAKPAFFSYDGVEAHAMEPEIYITEDEGSTYHLAIDSGNNKDYADLSNTLWWTFSSILAGDPADPQLYSDSTGGSEIVPEPPPSFLHIAQIGDRIWGVDAEDRARIWYTKPLVSGYAPEWSTSCTLMVGDDAVAVAAVGGIPTVLCEHGAWQIHGEGPDALGSGSFMPARKLPSDIGCIDPLSVCRTPIGTVFRGRRGFYVLDDAGQVNPFGLQLDPEVRAPSLSDYSYCRVVFDETHNEIRIIDRHTDHYYAFNIVEQKWSEWTQSATYQNVLDAAVVDGLVWYLHRDTGADVSIRSERGVDSALCSLSAETTGFITPWYRLDGVAGYGRLWELVLQLKLRSSSESDTVDNVSALTVSIETKGPDGASPAGTDLDTFSWTGAQLEALGEADGQIIELRMKPRYQNCKAFRVTFTEACTSAYSGSTPVALRLVMGVDGKAIKRARSGATKGAA